MSQNNASVKEVEMEDVEVESDNCCYSIMRSHSVKTVSTLRKLTYVNLKPLTREKNIKASPNKNQTLACQGLKMQSLNLKTAASCTTDPGYKLNITKQRSPEVVEQELCSPGKRSQIAKKCIEYKNKKIVQHRQKQGESECQQLLLTPPNNKEESVSTAKCTPRVEYFQDGFSPYTLTLFNQLASISQRLSQSQQSYSPERRRPGLKLSVSKSKKTLQLLYQKRSGRKIEIVDSESSKLSDSDQYSIAESYDWRRD